MCKLRFAFYFGLYALLAWSSTEVKLVGLYADIKSEKVAHSEIAWDKTIEIDPAIKTGILKNGMRYYILPKQTSSNAVSLRLLIRAGSFMETDKEDGLAHFIEHMAFNGTKHFAPGTLIHYFQDNGMGFGNDTNAFTSCLHTCYQIDLPKNDMAALRDGLKVLNDQAFECLFLQKEIDRERNVILSEMRTRDSANYRIFKDIMRFIYPHSLLSKRFVIGTKKTVDNFRSSDFFSFYKKWYTPDRMSIIVSGPVQSEKVVKLLQEIFIQQAGAIIDDPYLGRVEHPTKFLATKVFKDKELPDVSVSLHASHLLKDDEKNNTLKRAKSLATWELIQVILQQRLQELRDKTSIQSGHFHYTEAFNFLKSAELEFICQPKHLVSVIEELEKFNRSIHTFGFLQQELDTAKKIIESELKENCISEANKTAKEHVETIVQQLIKDNLIISSKQKQQIFSQVAPYITLKSCLKTWEEMWGNGFYFVVSGPLDETVNKSMVKKAFLKSKKEAIPSPDALEKLTFQSPFQKKRAAKIVKRQHNKALDMEMLQLDNNVRVNLKHTIFDKNRICIHVAIGCGMMDFKNSPYPGLPHLLTSSFVAGGLKQCSYNDLNRMIAGKLIGIDFDVDDDCYAFKCVTNRECLQEQLQLIGAYLLEPGYREEGVRRFRKVLPSWSNYFKHSPDGIVSTKVQDFLSCHDSRFGYPSLETMKQRNFIEARTILTPIFDKQYMEITIIGDFDRYTIFQDLLDTFGQLSRREAKKNIPENATNPAWPKPQTKIFHFSSDIDKAMLFIIWPTSSSEHPEHIRKIKILCSILRNRLIQEIRQTLGDTYSPRIEHWQSEAYDRGCIKAYLVLNPKKMNVIHEHVLTIAEDIAKNGVTQAELDRAIKPIISSLEKTYVTNGFWMEWLKNSQALPQKALWDLTNKESYQKITVKDISKIATKYFQRKSAICSHIEPESALKKAKK